MSYKPVGGVNKVYLTVAPLNGATTPTLSEKMEIPLLDQHSTYIEESEWMGSTPLTKHKLTLATSTQHDIAEQASLRDGLYSGFYVTIELNSGVVVSLNHTPLYLKNSEVNHGTKPLDTPTIKWQFEGQSSRCY